MVVRKELKTLDEQYENATRALKATRDKLQEEIVNEMKAAGRLSERYDNATATIAVRKSVSVVDEKAAVEDLARRGLTDYFEERLNDLFYNVFAKEMAKGGKAILAGVELKEKEYLSIRENRSMKDDKRKVTVE